MKFKLKPLFPQQGGSSTPSEVISLEWHEETPKPLDHYASQEQNPKNKQTNKEKIDVGVSSR